MEITATKKGITIDGFKTLRIKNTVFNVLRIIILGWLKEKLKFKIKIFE